MYCEVKKATSVLNSQSFSAKMVEYLPSNWSNDIRMNSMFSDFRNRDVNPVDYDTKVAFWTGAVTDWLEATSSLTFSMVDAHRAFVRKGRTPRCLDIVITELSKQGTLMRVCDFMMFVANPGWLSWSVDLLIKRPLSYTWSLISRALVTPKSEESSDYVNMIELKAKAEDVLSIYGDFSNESLKENPILFSTLHKKCISICRSESDLELCLLWLQKMGSVAIYNEQQCKVVKFLNGWQKSVTELSKTEKAIIQLGLVKKRLETQIDIHLQNIDKCVAEARDHLRMNSKPAAKAALLKKKQIEKSLVEKEITLENVEGLLERLQDVHTQKSVVEALQMGVEAFKQNDELDFDKVDDTMAAVTETLEIQNDIQNIMGTPVQRDVENITSLEEELDAILSDANPTANEWTSVKPDGHKEVKVLPKSLADELSDDMKRLSSSDAPNLPSPLQEFDFDAFNKKQKVSLLQP